MDFVKSPLTVALTLHLLCSIVFGQVGGIPYHVDSPISTKPSSPFREFSPKKNSCARRIVNEHFTIVYDLRKVDPQVLKVFHSKVPAREIANRGESFNATDVEVDLSQPSRRFVLAGTAPGIWLIVYEHGGRGYHHHLMVFTKQEDHWRLVAGVSGFLNGSTFGSLVRAIKANKFSDQPGYPEF